MITEQHLKDWNIEYVHTCIADLLQAIAIVDFGQQIYGQKQTDKLCAERCSQCAQNFVLLTIPVLPFRPTGSRLEILQILAQFKVPEAQIPFATITDDFKVQPRMSWQA